MPRLDRRTFLAGSASLLAAPALHLDRAKAADVDVVIIGAGAAGIAAARRVAAAKRSFRIFEAAAFVGGRCAVDTKSFGIPFDLGARWIHNPDSNPLVAAAPPGITITPAPRGQTLRVGARAARDSEMEAFLVAAVKARRALADVSKVKADMPAARLMPKDLGAFDKSLDFILGPLTVGKDLSEVSAYDYARMADRDSESLCQQGYGGLLARLAADLPVTLSTTVDAIYWGSRLAIDTPKGNLLARTLIFTASADVLATDQIEFFPPLPKRQVDAAKKLQMGSLDRIALEIPGNPFGLQRDDVVYEQATGTRTAVLHANVGGSALHIVEVGGAFGRELAGKGEAAMTDFAGEWLMSVFGTDVRSRIRRRMATRWTENENVRGAFAIPAPGASDARKILLEPLGGHVFFAGEALHDTQWGTVNGAWESGTRAADAALRKLGVSGKDDDDERPKKRRR